MYDALDRQGNTDKHDVRRWKLFKSEIGVHRRNDGGKIEAIESRHVRKGVRKKANKKLYCSVLIES